MGGGGGSGFGLPILGGGQGGSGTVILAIPTPFYPGSAPGASNVSTSFPGAPGMTVITYTTPSPSTPATFTYTG